MLGCGGGSGNGPVVVASDLPVVVASDPQLVAMWGRAQHHLATVNIVLNAAVVKATPGSLPNTVPPDPRALNVGDDGVTVIPMPDLTVAQLKAENPAITLLHKSDPTGVIHCPPPTTPTTTPTARYCASYISGSSIYVAKSLEYDDGATGYEMQNIILERLGYDISGR
jgi:hypothetical protein